MRNEKARAVNTGVYQKQFAGGKHKSFDVFDFNRPFFYGQSERRKRIKHEIFMRLIEMLEAKAIRYDGVTIKSFFHPSAVKELAAEGWTADDFRRAEQSLFEDAEYLPKVEILQNVSAVLWGELKKRNLENLIFENRIVAVPGEILNALICAELRREFSDSELSLCDVFVKIKDFGIDGEISEVWRLDVDRHLARRGFFVPMMKNGLIDGLKVFRFPDDSRPFKLRARYELIDLTNKEVYAEII